jgi:hypothetical protein
MFDTMTKGQSQVVSAVILGGILVVGISSAYTWAVPILEKNQDVDQLRSSINTMEDLEQTVQRVSTRGGSETLEMQTGGGLFVIDPSRNVINYTIGSQAAYVSTDSWVPLNENDMLGIRIAGNGDSTGIATQDRPGVVVGRAIQQGDNDRNVFHLQFRELQDLNSDTGFLINLTATGNLQSTESTAQIVVEDQGETRLPGESAAGGPLVVRNVGIRVE